MNRVPDFFIIGAAKAATTSLSSLLEQHPQVGMVEGKEPHFFSDDNNYRLGWPAYMHLYRRCHDKKAIGDASTSYSRIRYFPHTIARIHQHVPKAKIIYMVRHPIVRMESAYVEHACTASSQAIASINLAIQKLPMVVDSSRYWEVFEAYRKRFGEQNIKVVWFEEYIKDTATVFAEVCQFIGVDDTFQPDFERERMNSRDDAASRMARIGRAHLQLDLEWDPQVQRGVIDKIRADNLAFLAHFGRTKDYWGDLF